MTSVMDHKTLWKQTCNELIAAVTSLGFDRSFGYEIAKHLGSPKSMERMIAYLNYEKPESAELIADEMLAIRSEIDAWREKKENEQANAAYNEMLRYGFPDDQNDPY